MLDQVRAINALLNRLIANGVQVTAAVGALLDGSSNNVIIASGVASPVNQLTAVNAATGTHPIVKATGSDTNVGVRVQVKGTGAISLEGAVVQTIAVASISTAGAATLTAAQLAGLFIIRDPNGASRTDTTPTAAQLVAAMPGAQVNTGFEFTIRNAAASAQTITIAAGAGVTLSPTSITIPAATTRSFLLVFNNVTSSSEAVTIYSLTSGAQ
jgi:ribosomal protein S9